MFHLLWEAIIGLIVGALAKFIMPGKDPGGIFITMLIGIAASSIHYRETLVNTQTGTTRFVSRENSGLTAVVPVDYIQETIALHSRQLVRKT